MEKLKNISIYVLKVGIGLALILWILLQIDRGEFVNYFRLLTAGQILMLLPLSFLSLYIQFHRWKFLVGSYSTQFETKDLIPSFLAGFTLRLMVPGGHAEISKIFLLPGKKRGKAVAFGMERFFQTFIKIVLVAAVSPFHFPEYTALWIGLVLLLVLLYLFYPRIPVLREFLEREVNHHRIFGITLLQSLALFLIMTVQYYILLNGIRAIDLMQTAYSVIYMWSAGVVPISISGLGVREGLAVYFLGLYGFTAAQAVATALFLFTLNTIVPAIAGAYYLYRKREYFRDFKSTLKSTRELIKNMRNGK